MSALWIAAVLLAAPPDSNSSVVSPVESSSQKSSYDSADQSPLRTAQDLRREVSRRLRAEATSEGSANEAAIVALLELHKTLLDDRTLTKDERERLVNLVRARLRRVSKRIDREVRQQKALARRKGAKDVAPAEIHVPEDFANFLGQQLNNLGQNVGQRATDPGQQLLDLIKTTIRPETWDDNGGPGTAVLFPRFGSLGGHLRSASETVIEQSTALGGGAEADYGDALVELIQTTIAPNSWDANGGPGTIIYFRPLRVLVIRQTGEGHRNVGDVLGQLRDAGR